MSKRNSNDPRDLTRVTPYTPKERIVDEDFDYDSYHLMAMAVGLVGILMTSRLLCCISLVLAVASLTVTKASTYDWKQTVMTIVFTPFSILATYVPLGRHESPSVSVE